jgi:signal transduction histidine kinase
MRTNIGAISRILAWFKKNTEGEMLMQWISYFMIFSVLVIFILEYPLNAQPGWRFFGAVLALGLLLVINILWFQYHKLGALAQHRTLIHWVFNISTNLLVLGAFALTGSGEIIFLLLMQAAQFASMFGVWPAGAAYCTISLGIALGILKGYGLSSTDLAQVAAQFAAGLIFILVFVLLESRAVQQARRVAGLLKDLQVAHLELKSAQQKEKDLAVVAERMRLARDIHDGLGHHLTVLSIQLQAAEKLVGRDPRAAAGAIRVSRGEAQAALEEVRRSVGVMRQSVVEAPPLDQEISALVEDFDKKSGLQSSFELVGTPVELPPFARQTLFRTAQESLTNAQKHALNAEHVWVHLEYLPEAVCLQIRDDGQTGSENSSRTPGFGLVGLRERVEQLGGSLQSGEREEGGFFVDVDIPLKESRLD